METGILVLIAMAVGAFGGHYFTIKGISHVQPSTAEMNKIIAHVQDKQGDKAPEVQPEFDPQDIIDRVVQETGKQPEDLYGVPR